MLPALALAAAADWRAGLPPAPLVALAGWGGALVLALAFAADRGRGSWHAALWMCGVPGAALLAYALAGVGSMETGRGPGAMLLASPLCWALQASGRLSAGMAARELVPLAPLVFVLLLSITALASRRRAERGPA